MPQVIRTQITLNPAADADAHIMNTWHCVTVGATTALAAATSFGAALVTFYGAIDAYLAAELNGSQTLVRHFDLSHPKPRQPILEGTTGALATGSGNLPRELCCVLSYKGTYLSGVSPKRKRGRIYLGPLYASAVGSDGGFSATVVNGIVAAADTLLGVSDGSSEFRWVVYSPTSDPSGEGSDAACWDAVTEGWVDYNVDIQRRRGLPGGVRTLYS